MRVLSRSTAAAVLAIGVLGCGEPEAAAPTETVAGTETAPAREGPAQPSSDSPAQPSSEGLIPPRALADALPERLGTFVADGDAEHGIERSGAVVTTHAEQHYRDGDRVATLRAIDASRALDLVIGFAAAQQIQLGALDAQEIVAIGIAGRPGLAEWDPETQTSEAQVLAGNRLVLALTIRPCLVPEESVDVLEGAPIAALESLLRPR